MSELKKFIAPDMIQTRESNRPLVEVMAEMGDALNAAIDRINELTLLQEKTDSALSIQIGVNEQLEKRINELETTLHKTMDALEQTDYDSRKLEAKYKEHRVDHAPKENRE